MGELRSSRFQGPLTTATPRVRQIVARMDHVGRAAANASSMHRRILWLARLIPLVTKLAGRWSAVVESNALLLLESMYEFVMRGKSRRSVVALPAILRGTAAALVQRAQSGQPIPPSVVRQLFARAAQASLAPSRTSEAEQPDLARDRSNCPTGTCTGVGMEINCYLRDGQRCGSYLQMQSDPSGWFPLWIQRECCEPVPSPPPAACNWIAATQADVAQDQTQPRYAALLSSPVGYETEELHNGRRWRFRVVSSATDPGLTTFPKDVRGWICT
jgi:hypothetical protein